MNRWKRVSVLILTVVVAALLVLPSFACADEVSDNYLYEITDKITVNESGVIKQPGGIQQGYPLQYTMLVYYGELTSFSYKYHNGSSLVSGSAPCLIPSGNLTFVILSGKDNWYQITPTSKQNKLMAAYIIVYRSWQDLTGTFQTDWATGIPFDFGSTGAVGCPSNALRGDYYTSKIYIYPATPEVPFLDKSCITISGYFTDLTGVSCDVPYTAAYVHTITLDPSYHITANGEAISKIELSGLSSQVGESTIHAGDLYLEGKYTTAGGLLHASNTGDIDITVPDSNVELSGTNKVNYEGVTYDAIPTSAISSIYTSVTLTFDGVVPDKITAGVGVLAYADGSSNRNVYVTGKYLIGELPNDQSQLEAAIYTTLYQFTKNFDTTVLQVLRNFFNNTQKPFYQEWFEKFITIFERGTDEDTNNAFSEAEDKINGISSGLSQAPSLDISSVEFNAPTLDSNNLLLVVINQGWEIPFFVQAVAVIVGCIVLAFLLFGRKG